MSATLKTIVIGTSLSEVSDEIVRAGAAVARASGAAVWLVHVYAPSAFPPDVGMEDAELYEQQVEILRDLLAKQAYRTGLTEAAGYDPGRLRLVMGSPPRELLEISRQAEAGLLVIDAVEGGALHRILLGSTAEEVIRKTPCPVLLARSAAAFPPLQVEIPVDLSPCSANALRQGLDLLAGLGAAPETEVLFVLNPLEVAGSIHFTPEQVERMAGEELERFLAANASGPVPPRTRVLTGYPRETIVSALEERRADLAILGTHGHGGFERLMLGSVASEVVRRAGCNVLVVPPAPGPAAQDTAKTEQEVLA